MNKAAARASLTAANSFGCRTALRVGDREFTVFSLAFLEVMFPGIAHLPFSVRVLLENLLRREDGRFVHAEDVEALARWQPLAVSDKEIAFTPSRVLLQDFTGVPAVVDLAAMRDAMKRLGGDPERINPLLPVDLVIDHSVQVDRVRLARARWQNNAELEFKRNRERYEFLRWGQKALPQFPRRAAGHGHRPPGQPGVPGQCRLHRRRPPVGRWPIPTRWSAPTRTRR